MGDVISINSRQFNGHRSWDHWNVALWLSNDECLYQQALEILEAHPDPRDAAETFLWFFDLDGSTTPDGAEFNLSTVTEALRDLSED